MILVPNVLPSNDSSQRFAISITFDFGKETETFCFKTAVERCLVISSATSINHEQNQKGTVESIEGYPRQTSKNRCELSRNKNEKRFPRI